MKHVDATSLVVVDVEATSDDAGSVPREEMEVIEFGAVLVDRTDLQIRSEFQAFVRPVRHPVLTSFCTRLTSISQGDVDGADEFPVVAGRLAEWMDGFPSPLCFCSWGDYDKNQIARDARFHGVADPMPSPHSNLKAMYSERQGLRKKLGLGQALRHAGLTFEGTAHRGIDDARNIARLLPHIVPTAPVND